jgi:hypothetical protein
MLSLPWLQPQLQHLDLSCDLTTNVVIEVVARLPRLRSLVLRDVSNYRLVAAALSLLDKSTSLRSVALVSQRELRTQLDASGVFSAMLELERASGFRICWACIMES